MLRQAAQLRDGNTILQSVARQVASNFLGLGPPVSQDMLTAMTQLAVTGSNAFAAWFANPVLLTPFLTQLGMPLQAAVNANQQIMSDFNAARNAVRNPAAGMNEDSLRAGLAHKWIAVSGEDDPPDFPVNVKIAPFPQFHFPITVQAPKGAIDLSIRYILASSQIQGALPGEPYMPPGDEVVLFIHGEGSRAEEALDFIPELFSVGADAGRRFTVFALDLPGFGYTTKTSGLRGPLSHWDIADMPAQSGVPGVFDTSGFAGSPLLDFIENSISTFVEKLIVPFGNPITAVVGGSLGGHMALRLAASQKDWVQNVVAWSPASVEEHDFTIVGISIPQSFVANPVLAGRATDGAPWPLLEQDSKRQDFVTTVFYQNTADVRDQWFGYAYALAGALLLLGFVAAFVGAFVIANALYFLAIVPPQPIMWYRDDWPPGALVRLPGYPPLVSFYVGVTKAVYIQEALWDRLEVYNTNFRQWHWRICEELLGFSFDALAPNINKPLLLMVGELDDYPDVHFFGYVKDFASTLNGPGLGLTVADTGHSIHNERPHFLASQVASFAPTPVEAVNSSLTEFFAEILPSIT
jgi:pimeloyl-ACP methyl ester carboxylesterase